MNKKGFATLAIALIVVAILIAGGIWYYIKNISSPTPLVACTMEAKECPDGSYVGRTGPNCEFAACPSVTSSISLPTAYTNVQYDASLQIVNSNIPNGQWEVASTSGQLPPGLSIAHFEHGCAPFATQCLQNNFDLDGKATQVGTYAFSIAFSIGGDQIIQHYQVQVLPQNQESNMNQGTSSNKTCESNLNCPAKLLSAGTSSTNASATRG